VTSLMLAGYNAGPFAVRAARGIPQNGQTPAYVARILSMAPALSAPSPAAAGPFAARFIAAAEAEIGVPYAWAGGNYSGPTPGVCAPSGAEHDCRIVGLDCSGLVMYAAYVASSGRIPLSHYTDTQVNSDAIKYRAAVIPRGAQRPGDVIAFYEPGLGIAHHVGIYIGNGQMIDAPESGELVRVDSLGTSYYQSQGWKVVRYS
jgi:cell wall-associated NlpC family hydrolase